MSDVVTNLKVRFGADSRGLKKGTDEGKKAVQHFTGQASDSMSKFAQVFGVNMGAVTSQINTVKSSTGMLAGGFKSAAAGSSVLTRALKTLKIALISTGIGALVVALGSLIGYFTNTQRGADKLAKVSAALGAIWDVIVDRVSALGEKIVWAFTHPTEAISEFWESLKKDVVNRFSGIIQMFQSTGDAIKALFKGDWEGLKKSALDAGVALMQVSTGIDPKEVQKGTDAKKSLIQEIKEEAAAAWKLQEAQNKLKREEVELIESMAKRRKEIEALRLVAKDETKSAEERRAAIQKAAEIEKSILADELRLQQEKVRILAGQQALGENMLEDDRELAQEKARLHELEARSLKMQKRLQTEYNTLTNKIEANINAHKKLVAERNKAVIKPLTLDIKMNLPDKISTKAKVIQTDLGNLRDATIDFANVFNSNLENGAIGFGEFVGNLMAGTAGLQDFGSLVFGTLGDLSVQVGKIAIATGLAIAGIREALRSLNPVVAIAAGVALVALGTFVKGSLSRIADGGSSGGTFSANSYGGSQSIDARTNTDNASRQTQSVNVKVSGELKLKNNTLAAAIKKEQSRKTIMT